MLTDLVQVSRTKVESCHPKFEPTTGYSLLALASWLETGPGLAWTENPVANLSHVESIPTAQSTDLNKRGYQPVSGPGQRPLLDISDLRHDHDACLICLFPVHQLETAHLS